MFKKIIVFSAFSFVALTLNAYVDAGAQYKCSIVPYGERDKATGTCIKNEDGNPECVCSESCKDCDGTVTLPD